MNALKALAEWMAPRAKAIAAGVAPVVLLLLALMPDGLTLDEWTQLVLVGMASAGITYAVPNAAAKPAAVKPSRR